jgi:SAM-dependent methyltransferase
MAEHAVFAATYERVMEPAERAGLRDRRIRLLSNARGKVLEVGGGTGVHLPLYRGVESVDVLEPDAAMRRRLTSRLAAATVPVTVHESGIDEAPFGPAAFDTIVSTLTLCTVPDLDRALERIRTLLAPDGRLLFLEHVPGQGAQRLVQRAVGPVWPRLAGGCHLDRDIPAALRRTGFSVLDLERFTMPTFILPVRAAVQGVARVAR